MCNKTVCGKKKFINTSSINSVALVLFSSPGSQQLITESRWLGEVLHHGQVEKWVMSRNDESPVLLVATVFCAWFCLCTLAQQSTLSGANFVKFPLSVLVVPSEILASSGAKSSLDCAFRCLKTAFCISFNFGINSQTCELLATDKFRFSTMFNSSEDSDHYTFMVSVKDVLLLLSTVYENCLDDLH